MAANNSETLTICKASAGSGKTYKLVESFLMLALDRDEKKYARILAITFTRKATAEMKQRVLNNLKLLSEGNADKNLTNSLQQQLGIDHTELKRRANIVLLRILHDYSRFSVSTIDQFFQRILRSTARELNIPGMFRIEMNDEYILKRAILQFLEKINTESGRDKLSLLTQFIETEIIENNKRHDIQKEIFTYMNQMMRENIKDTLISLVPCNDFDQKIEELRKKLQASRKGFEVKYKELAVELKKLIDRYPNSSQFRKTGNKLETILKFDLKPNKEIVNKLFDLPEELSLEDVLKKNKSEAELSEQERFIGDVNRSYRILIKHIRSNLGEYIFIREVLPMLWQIQLFRHVWNEVLEITDSENLFLLSNTALLLRQITQRSNTPFIYEKMGTWYKHFMIDEFQDTSLYQWENIKPFLEESMAQTDPSAVRSKCQNLIIGDVKQAIYRWRNGDWTLLNNQVENQLTGIQTLSLTTNWRSGENVVNFNNHFFQFLKESLALPDAYQADPMIKDLLQSMYGDCIQQSTEKMKGIGYVSIELIDPKNDSKSTETAAQPEESDESENSDYSQLTLQRVAQRVQTLLKEGATPGQIAILTRTGAQGKKIIDHLLSHDDFKGWLQISTDDVLTLHQSNAVNAVIHIIKHITLSPQSTFYAVIAARLIDMVRQENNLSVFTDATNHSTIKIILNETDSWKRRSVYDLVLEIISRFKLHDYPSEMPFLQRLLGVILEFGQTTVTDKRAFLEYWDTKGKDVKIPAPETSDALKVMTIHKSKGLEFNHVIIPFVDWEINPAKSAQWIEEEFDSLKLPLLIKPTEIHLHSRSANKIRTEVLNRYIDSLNLLYVAFTRAKLSLHIFSNKNAKANRVSLWIKNFIESNNATLFYETGSLSVESTEEKERRPETISQFTINTEPALKIRYAETQPLERTDESAISPTQYGSLLHKVLENIDTPEEIDIALRKLFLKGLMDNSERLRIKKLLDEAFRNPMVQRWFHSQVKALNERAIVTPGENLYRPDRIVVNEQNQLEIIDFKFTHEPKEEHQRQVNNYLTLLIKAGYNVAGGYIWYVFQNKVVGVNA